VPGYGLPSGHAQLSLSFLVPLAVWLSSEAFGLSGAVSVRGRGRAGAKIGVWAAAVLLLGAIAFSRLYLGVHFPTDILGGWFMGGIALTIYFALGDRIAEQLTRWGMRFRMISAALLALGMNTLYPQGRGFGGLFLGFVAGYNLMEKRLAFSARGSIRGGKPGFAILALRYILGIAGAWLAYWILKTILPGSWSPYYGLSRFIHYGAVGLWVSAGAPWLFLRLSLVGRKE
jgi:hypothetical protein